MNKVYFAFIETIITSFMFTLIVYKSLLYVYDAFLYINIIYMMLFYHCMCMMLLCSYEQAHSEFQSRCSAVSNGVQNGPV